MQRETPTERRDAGRQFTLWCFAIITVIAVVAAAKSAEDIVVPSILAGLVALTLTPLVSALERIRIPGPIAALVVMSFTAATIAGGLYVLAPSADEWRRKAPSIIRSVEWQLRDLVSEIEQNVEDVTGETSGGEEGSTTDKAVDSGRRMATDVLLKTPEYAAMIVYMAFLCYFLLVEKVALRRFVLAFGASTGVRLRLARAMRDMRREVGRYLLTITVINTVLGLAVAGLFWQIGLPNPLLWGALAGVLNFMPYIGPIILNVIVFFVAMGTFHDIVAALYPIAGLVVINTIEGSFVTPTAVGHRVQVGALSVFVALAFFSWLWGLLGALLAAPLLILGKNVWRRMNFHMPFVPATVIKPTADGERRGDDAAAAAAPA